MADDCDPPTAQPEPSESERWGTLFELEEWLEKPMLVLSFAWLALARRERPRSNYRRGGRRPSL